jgi:hypothetical protein
MFTALSPQERARVYRRGEWLRHSGTFTRLDPQGFKLPVDPLYVPIPPAARDLVARYSSSVVDPPEPEVVTPVAGPSTARTGRIPEGGPTVFGTG